MAQKTVSIVINRLADGTTEITLNPETTILEEGDTLQFEAFIAPELEDEAPRAVFEEEGLSFTESEVELHSIAPPPPPGGAIPMNEDDELIDVSPGDVLSEHVYSVQLDGGALQSGRIKIIRQQ